MRAPSSEERSPGLRSLFHELLMHVRLKGHWLKEAGKNGTVPMTKDSDLSGDGKKWESYVM